MLLKSGVHTSRPSECFFLNLYLCANKCKICVSFRGNMIMTHTLTAFMELMDHGIVSWENLSSIFIKKVLHLHLYVCVITDLHTTYQHSLLPFPCVLSVYPSPFLFCLPKIASFVNAKPTDASIQQVSLDILESMVLSSHSLFLQVKQEVTMERLIAHLQV